MGVGFAAMTDDKAWYKQRIARLSKESISSEVPQNEAERQRDKTDHQHYAELLAAEGNISPMRTSSPSVFSARSTASSPELGRSPFSPSISPIPSPIPSQQQQLQRQHPASLVPELDIVQSQRAQEGRSSPPLLIGSPIAGVRPQWTPRTSAGRAKLMTESDNWEAAESAREEKKARELVMADRLRLRKLSNTDEATLRKGATRNALDSSREEYRKFIEELGREGKRQAEDIRRQHAEARQAWQARGSALPRAQENTQRANSEFAKVVEANAMYVAKFEAFMKREIEDQVDGLNARKAQIREAGQRMRRMGQMSRRVSKEALAREREATVEATRQRQQAGERQLAEAKANEASRRIALHDSVARRLSTGHVRDFKDQERRRKEKLAAEAKAQSILNRQRYEQAVREDEARKKRLHDGVRRAINEGNGDTDVFAYSSVMHSGTSLWSHAVGYSRTDGERHRFRHNLPNAKSPAGRWLREYANQVIGARTSSARSLSKGSSPPSRTTSSRRHSADDVVVKL